MKKYSGGFRADYFCYAFILFSITNYFMPYDIVIEPMESILVGFPLKWLQVYDLYTTDKLVEASFTNAVALILDIIFYYWVVAILGYIFKYIEDKSKKLA